LSFEATALAASITGKPPRSNHRDYFLEWDFVGLAADLEQELSMVDISR
jgi:hypothetical protein